jgi:enoyl-CoA hydratase/carnithine racemase
MASDLRLATERARVAFLFNKVGLAGCDMGACAILPRIIGQGRASELLYTGRFMSAPEGERWGFFTRLVAEEALLPDAKALAATIASGPTFANTMTNRGRGCGPGALHDDRGFPPRLPRLRRTARAGVRGELG